ncbi:hypothetical protein MHI24_26205 [Paenibacillus sp. FSL K6-1096]|uniref:hypothetical protein n=1 Tax=Paenibacillus sp. FSL K6-1096 TaxID=2921460 RepID=UPI0030ECFABD
MSVPKRMDKQSVRELVADDYSIDDILESVGILTPNEAKKLSDEIQKMREE